MDANPLNWISGALRWRTLQKELETSESKAELLATELRNAQEMVAFLLERLTDFDTTVPRETVGRASNALIVAAARNQQPRPAGAEPFDRNDLDRCERTYLRAPAYLQARMLPILEEWRIAIGVKERRGQ